MTRANAAQPNRMTRSAPTDKHKNGLRQNVILFCRSCFYICCVIITLSGICVRRQESENECIKKLDEHVRLFCRTYNTGYAE